MNLTHNEKVKLAANFLNGIAIAIIAIGGIGAIFNVDLVLWIAILRFASSVVLGTAVHFLAQRLLSRRLKE